MGILRRVVRKIMVREPSSENAIGHAELTAISPQHRTCRISRVLVGPGGHRGKGWGTEIARELLRKAFSELRVHRVELGVYDFNAATIRCYEKLGLIREGTRRECVRFGTEYWNSIVMAILEDELSAG